MTVERRVLLTKILVVLSIFLSLAGIATNKYGWGEIYPFFYWKLYTQPLGNKNEISDYRIYARHSANEIFKRLPIKNTPTFTDEEYTYTFNYLINNVFSNKNDTLKKRNLLVFIKEVEPGFNEYKVVEEKYKPLEIYKNTNAYDTATVIRF